MSLKETNENFWEPINQYTNYPNAIDKNAVYVRHFFANNQDGVPKVYLTDDHMAMQNSENKSTIYLDANGFVWARKFLVQNMDGVAKTFITEDTVAIEDGWDNTNVYLKSDGNAFFEGSVSANSFTDRTPAYTGDALSELYQVKDDGNGNIDHSTLPNFARKTFLNKEIKSLHSSKTDKSVDNSKKDGRDIGAMISILTRAIQQLIDKNNEQYKIIENLNTKVNKLSN